MIRDWAHVAQAHRGCERHQDLAESLRQTHGSVTLTPLPRVCQAIGRVETTVILRTSALVLVFWSVSLGAAVAEPLWVKNAKDLGYPAQNCLYCHSTKLPKKETYTPGELNDRGRWLVQERERRRASQVDLSWLKDYPGGIAQK